MYCTALNNAALHSTMLHLISFPYTVSVLWQEEGYTMKYSLRKILRAKPKGFPKLSLYFIVFPDSSHNTYILNYKSSIDLSVRLLLEELILRIAPTAGQYKKILPTNIDICKKKKSLFFRLLSRLSKLDLCGLFFYWILHDLDNYYVKKIPHKSSLVRHDHESNLKKN